MESKGIIEIDGFKLAYLIEGKGTPVLIVGSTAYYPQLFSKEIKKQLKLIFIDHRGYGNRKMTNINEFFEFRK